MASRTAPAFVDALKTIIEARAGFIALGGEVATAPIAPDAPHPERVIVFVRVDSRVSEFASIKGDPAQVPQDEEYVWEGTVIGIATGSSEAAAVEARNAAAALLDELDGALRDNRRITGARSNILVTADWDQGIWRDGGRVCQITFGVRVRHRI